MANDDEVGYGRPPKHTQFKKGRSGNPKGRPKGSRNVRTVMDDCLLAPMPMSVNGKQVWRPTIAVVITKLIAEIGKGNMTAARILFGYLAQAAPIPANDAGVSGTEGDQIAPEDEEIIRQALPRLGPQRGGGDE